LFTGTRGKYIPTLLTTQIFHIYVAIYRPSPQTDTHRETHRDTHTIGELKY